MKCNCIKEFEEQLKNRAKEMKDFQKSDNEIRVSAQGMMFLLNGAPDSYIPYQEFEVTQDYITKTGKNRTKKEKVNILFGYCPYCGRKLEKEKSDVV
ncbi:MAG: hypothetical protein ACRC1T_05145 [Clostridium chrysemydis]|uniref:hypothetical protein n=1 Tax=Clostridium chrysemydis TaxID=2665504 RepID=UPI003F3351CF